MAKLTRRVRSIYALLENAEILRRTFGSDALWWRGQANHTWPLLPSTFRAKVTREREWELATRFMQRAPTRRSDLPARADWLGWLTLMQHHQLPTRLLDWTESLLIAAHFAVSDHPDADGTVWALNPFTLNQSVFKGPGIATANHAKVLELAEAAFRKKADQDLVLAFYPHETDTRMLLQQSAFTIHGSSRGIAKSRKTSHCLARLNIPAEHKAGIRADLEKLGIRQSTLFPDLDNLARDIRSLYRD